MISVLVADDSALVRRLISGVLNDAPDIKVIGTAQNGARAIERIAELKPDILTLDIEMPVMDGLTAMREIHQRFPRLPVIMVSTLTQSGASVTLDALAAGARDYVTKPSNSISLKDSLGELSAQLLPRIRALVGKRAPAAQRSAPRRPVSQPVKTTAPRSAPARALQVVAIGSSTGGPDALARVLSAIREKPTVPLVAVQHMPPVFTTMLAQRLDRLGPVDVVEAADGQPLQAGTLYIAPGGRHLEVARRGNTVITKLHDGAPENYSRPSVDVLFRSVAEVYPGSGIAIVLTGMGRDGKEGSAIMGSGGSMIVAQDEDSSVVWGMPGAVYEAGLADSTLPLDHIGPFLNKRVSSSRTVHSGVAS